MYGLVIEEGLKPEDFYRDRHRLIYESMLTLYRDSEPIDVLLDDELKKMERLSREHTSLTGTPSGFRDLDEITGGFQPGNLIIIAARPSMGKCLRGSALVYDPTTGCRHRLDDVVELHES